MNPFVFGETVSDENFCNREDEIENLVEEIKSSQNLMIYSPRRFGKTSLVYKVLSKLNKKSFFTFYIDLYPIVSETDFAKISLKSFSKLFNKNIKFMLKNIKNFFKQISPNLSAKLSNDGTPAISIDFSKSESIPVIQDIFTGIYEYIISKGKKGVIVFDEFQQIGELDDSHKIEKILRSTIQHHRDISYIFMGSKKHLLFNMFNTPNRPFYKSSMHFPLEKIDSSKFSKFIKNKFTNTNKNISNNISEYIVNTAESHSY